MNLIAMSKKPLLLQIARSCPRLSKLSTSLKWRNKLRDHQITTEIASILLQRKRWIPTLLSKPSLLSGLSPHRLHQILHRTQYHPDLSLHFFNWAHTTLNFRPYLKSYAKLATILLRSDLSVPAKELLEPIIQSQPSSSVIESVSGSSSCKQSRSLFLSFVLEIYSGLRLVSDALETFRAIRGCRGIPSTRSCNAFLDTLCSSGLIRDASCVYAEVLRVGMVPDGRSWSLLAQLLCKQGKLNSAVRLFGLHSDSATFDLVVGCYSKRGDFGAAIGLLNGTTEKGLKPRFGSYSSILNGACEFGNLRVVGLMLKDMIVKELLPVAPCLDYSWVIRRLCEGEKTFAAEMFFWKARRNKIGLERGSYLCFLRALVKQGRMDEGISVYNIMKQEGLEMDSGCLDAFVTGICKGQPSEEVNSVLKDVIVGGFKPKGSDLSKYIAVLCQEGRWIADASDLLRVGLDNGILLDGSCCSTLVKHYCANRLVDSAFGLHDNVRMLGGCLDVTSYNVLLRAVLAARKIEKASQVFEYMRLCNVLDSSSYVIMVSSLCQERKLREAMKLHDEMLKVGLKPDDTIYKNLITGFV